MNAFDCVSPTAFHHWLRCITSSTVLFGLRITAFFIAQILFTSAAFIFLLSTGSLKLVISSTVLVGNSACVFVVLCFAASLGSKIPPSCDKTFFNDTVLVATVCVPFQSFPSTPFASLISTLSQCTHTTTQTCQYGVPSGALAQLSRIMKLHLVGVWLFIHFDLSVNGSPNGLPNPIFSAALFANCPHCNPFVPSG